jgi:uncharacterized membrane protein YvbJ
MKNCPYCAEEIQDEAIKCKHCGEYLTKENQDDSGQVVGATDRFFGYVLGIIKIFGWFLLIVFVVYLVW